MPANLDALVDSLSALTQAETGTLADMVVEKWGVTINAVVTQTAPPVEVVAEKTEFTVILTGFGTSKIEVIKAVRAITLLGLKEAKDLVDAIPKVIKADVDKAEATRIQGLLVTAGATVTVA